MHDGTAGNCWREDDGSGSRLADMDTSRAAVRRSSRRRRASGSHAAGCRSNAAERTGAAARWRDRTGRVDAGPEQRKQLQTRPSLLKFRQCN
jgi:hypothetical protein